MKCALRLLVLATVCCLATRLAAAAATMSPNPLDAGTVSIGTSGMVNGTLSATNNDRVDLVVGSCSGGGGTFTFQPNLNINLSSPQNVMATFMATASGSRSCTVYIYLTGTTQQLGSFTVKATGQAPPSISTTTLSAFTAVRALDAAVAPHTSTRTLTVSNLGDLTLNITNVTFTSDFSIDPSSANGTTTTIAAAGAKTWTIRFDPSAVGPRPGTVTFASNDPATPNKTVNLTGDGTSGNFTIAASNGGNFGDVAAGSSAGLDITVTHSGGSPKGILTFAASTVVPADAGKPWFAITASPNTLSNATQTGTVTVTCSPPAGSTAAASATVYIQADADGTAMRSQVVTCQAVSSLLALGPMSSVDFGGQLVGGTSAGTVLRLTNTGNVMATIGLTSGSANQGRFTVTGCAAPNSGLTCNVAPNNGFVDLTTTFAPNAEGTVSASFQLSGSGGLSFIASGRGIDRHIELPESVQFEDTFRNPGAKATVSPVTILNNGEYPIQVSNLVMGAGEDVWSVDATQTLPFMVPGLGTFDVMVRFGPRFAGKADDGQLMIVNDDPKVAAGMPIVFLAGNGKDRNVDVSPGVIDLGDRAVGVPTRLSEIRPDQLVSIVNMDTSDFTIRAITFDGPAMLEAEDASGGSISGALLEAGAVRMVDLVFTPTEEGEFTSGVGVYLDEDPVPQKVMSVTGRAVSVEVHGGGGCSTGAGGGPAVLLVLLVVRRRRHRR